jgi:uncharacterized protein YndB with AHSA1/START domain
MAARHSLTLKRRIKGSPAQIFAAWTNPTKMTAWLGPEGAYDVTATADARVGGRYRLAFRTPDGEMNDARGVYREVVQNEKLVFTWAWQSAPEEESVVTITLKADGPATLLTFVQEPFVDEEARDDHRGGWEGAFDKLEEIQGA